MDTAQPLLSSAFIELPIIGILRGFSPAQGVEAATAAAAGGLAAVEITMNTPGVLTQIEAVRRRLPAGVAVGAGTVTSAEHVRQAVAAGASFIVSPVVDVTVIRASLDAGVPVFPGALTPTEILSAVRAGARMVKLFPAGSMGPGYLKAVKAPLESIPLLATGGIGLDNVGAFLAAGADGFGIGSPLFDREKVERGQWEWITQRVLAFRQIIRSFREQTP